MLIMASTLRFRTVSALVLIYAALASASGPVAVSTQYHAQDELGQYSYGYSGGPSSKSEVKTADGVVRGQYSYIDAHGIIQTATYIADPVHGFRVAATNSPVGPTPVHTPVHTPVVHAPVPHHAPVAYHHAPAVAHGHYSPPGIDTPEVQVAKAHHFAAVAEAKARNAGVAHHVGYYPAGAAYVPYAAAHTHPAYYTSVKDTPEVHAAKVAHFAEVHEAKARAHHAHPYDHYGHGLYHVPVPVTDTPEVSHAKAAHLAAVHQAKSLAYHGGYPDHGGYYGYAAGHAYHVPVPVKDTPEVAAAKAAHFAAVHEAKSRLHYEHAHYGGEYYPYASGHVYHVPVPVKDTPEVAAAKAAHYAAVHETKARDYHASYPSHHDGYYHYDAHHSYVPVPVTDTPAVAHAKAAHLAAVHHVKANSYSHHGW